MPQEPKPVPNDLIRWQLIELSENRPKTIYSGDRSEIFAIDLQPTFKDRLTEVLVDGKRVELLTDDNTYIVVRGKLIELKNLRQPQQTARFLGPLMD